MIKAFKAYFLSRLLREKILLVGFALLVAATWLSSVAGRLGRFGSAFHGTSQLLALQQKLLTERPAIEAAAKQAVAQLDPARTFDSAHLQGEINTLAAAADLPSNQIDARPSAQTDQFSVHTVQFSVRKAGWDVLQRFYVELSKRSPYISIDQCSISADRANPAQLNVTMQISSVEIAQ